ncbi:uncharacterized protein LOC119950992 [Scyliorhinus canicula]|uniref:uncharacterized protein LOC119950992 n=1 Tax=Scyliorhinus canicula TaxID=7830 RepID=UPI0018F52BB2|nr:uncharacterized protein LOC119950992 [Scyliorhinus canicula]
MLQETRLRMKDQILRPDDSSCILSTESISDPTLVTRIKWSCRQRQLLRTHPTFQRHQEAALPTTEMPHIGKRETFDASTGDWVQYVERMQYIFRTNALHAVTRVVLSVTFAGPAKQAKALAVEHAQVGATSGKNIENIETPTRMWAGPEDLLGLEYLYCITEPFCFASIISSLWSLCLYPTESMFLIKVGIQSVRSTLYILHDFSCNNRKTPANSLYIRHIRSHRT